MGLYDARSVDVIYTKQLSRHTKQARLQFLSSWLVPRQLLDLR